MILFAVYVSLRINPAEDVELQPFYLPRSFLLTTVNLIAISTFLHLAVQSVKMERLVDFNRYIWLASISGVIFFLLQGSGLTWMIQEQLKPDSAMLNLYGFTFFLVVVHALHVVGGMAGLVMVIFGMRKKAYDHERYFPVQFCAIYWHFLDVVWILMMLAFAYAAAISK